MRPEPHLLHHLLDGTAAASPDRIAVIDGERSATYAELHAVAQRLARRFLAAGLERGDRVAVVLPKSLEECAAIFAVAMAGGVVVPVNVLLKPAQIRHIVADCAARIVLTRDGQLADLRDAFAGLDTVLLTVDGVDAAEAPPALALPPAALAKTSPPSSTRPAPPAAPRASC